MYQSIIIECQTQNGNPNCEDCIALKTCNLQKKIHSTKAAKEQLELAGFPVQCQ